MKINNRLIRFCMAFLLTFSIFISIPNINNIVSAADNPITVEIDGQRVNFPDQQPVIVNGRTLVPVRGVFEQLGYTVEWNQKTKTVMLSNEINTVLLVVGKSTFTTNGKTYNLDVPAQIISDRTMLPFRAVLESVGCNVDWDDSRRTVIVSVKGSADNNSTTNFTSAMKADEIKVVEKINALIESELSTINKLLTEASGISVSNDLGKIARNTLRLNVSKATTDGSAKELSTIKSFTVNETTYNKCSENFKQYISDFIKYLDYLFNISKSLDNLSATNATGSVQTAMSRLETAKNFYITALNDGKSWTYSQSNTEPSEPSTTSVAETAIFFDISTANLEVNDTVIINVTFAPINTTNKALTWTSSNSKVARVDNSGRVTAVANGSTTITAKSTNGKTASCTITVTKATVPVNSVTLNASNISIEKERSQYLTATVLPANATNKNINWTSSNTNIVRVDSNGLVTAIAVGTGTITATSVNGIIASCDVTVFEISVKEIKINNPPNKVSINGEDTINVSLLMSDNTDIKPSWSQSSCPIIWTSSNKTVAYVEERTHGGSGGFDFNCRYILKGLSAGTATITVTAQNGVMKSFVVTVEFVDITEVNIRENTPNGATLSDTMIAVGESKILSGLALPTNTSLSRVLTWTSSDPNVVRIDAITGEYASGATITGISSGISVITATAANGMTASFTVLVLGERFTISKMVTGIVFSKSEYTILWDTGSVVNQSMRVMPYVVAESSSVAEGMDNLTWTISNQRTEGGYIPSSQSRPIAEYKDGYIVFNSTGSATITVTAPNGQSASCTIRVWAKSSGGGGPFDWQLIK